MSEDIFRKVYAELSHEQMDLMRDVKEKSESLIMIIDSVGRSREMSLAITKLEECVMWAIKGITEKK